MKEGNQSKQNFDKVTKEIKASTPGLSPDSDISFSKFKHLSKKILIQLFNESSDTEKNNFPEQLFKWSQDKLHSKITEQRIAGICGFSFYISITENQEKILQLPQTLMKLLQYPEMAVLFASGISYLFKRIWIHTTPKFSFNIEQYLEKINQSLDGRPSDFAVVSSLFLYHQSAKLNSYLLQKYAYYIDTIIKSAILIPNSQVQKTTVRLSEMRFAFDPSAYDTATNLISHLKYTLHSKISDKQAFGVFYLLSSLLKSNPNVCESQYNEIIDALEIFFNDHAVENYLIFLPDLLDCLNPSIIHCEDRIFKIVFYKEVLSSKIENCQNISKIMKYLPNKFCPHINEKCFQLALVAQDCYFLLMKSVIQYMPTIVDRQFVLGTFKKLKFTSYMVDTAVLFAHTYISEIFQFIHIFVPKITNLNIDSLRFLSEISFLSEFPLIDYWDMVYDCFLNESKEIHIASIPALTSIIQRFKQQEQKTKLFSLLFSVQDDSSEVKLAFLNSINDSLLPLFVSPDLFFIIQELYQDEDFEVSKSVISLITRIGKISPLTTLPFFHKKLDQFQDFFFQIPAKTEQKHFLKSLPIIISGSGRIVVSHGNSLTNFLLSILNSEPIHFTTMSNRTKDIKNIKNDKKMRIYALKSLRSLIKYDHYNTSLVAESIDSIVNQLGLYRKRALHISAIKTLRKFFRRFKILDLVQMNDLIRLHHQIFQFTRTSLDAKVNYQIFRLLGSIGPLGFPEFHTPRAQSISPDDSYPLYDRSKREQSFLNFVMKYILNELRTNSKTHDLSSLVNAILYIFQSDPQKCFAFLDQVVEIFASMFEIVKLNREDSIISSSEYFHFFKIIVSVVDIQILPHADTIYKLIFPFLTPHPQLDAVELLNSLIFALKSAFTPYGTETFTTILTILYDPDQQTSQEVEDSLLLAMTLIVIYANGSVFIYFEALKSILIRRNILIDHNNSHLQQKPLIHQSLYPLLFLGQILYNSFAINIVIPSLRIAFQLFEMDGALKEIAFSLINLILIKYSHIVDEITLDTKTADIIKRAKNREFPFNSIRGIINNSINNNSITITTSDDTLLDYAASSSNNNENGNNPLNGENRSNSKVNLNDEKMLRSYSMGSATRFISGFPNGKENVQYSMKNIQSPFSHNQDDLFLKDFESTPYVHQSPSKPPYPNPKLKAAFSEQMKSFVTVKDWPGWLLQFTQSLVLCSHSPAIRASSPLLRQSPTFVSELFPYIIVSVWDNATNEERKSLSTYLLTIIYNQTTSNEILSAIAAACDAMDRANFALFEHTYECGKVAERCNSWFRALRFFEMSLSEKNFEPASNLLRINALLKQKEAALGLLKIAIPQDSNPGLLETLSMWSQARDIYKIKYHQSPKNESYLTGFLKCSMHLEDWESIEKCIEDFPSYSQDMKLKVAMIFATAVRNTGDDPTEFLKVIKVDDPMTCMLHSIVSIDQDKLDDAALWIKHGLALTCLDMSCFSSGSYEPAIPTICLALNFEELNDIIDQRKGLKTTNEVIEIWKAKSPDYIKRDATQLRYVCQLRELLQWSDEQLITFHISFVDSLRKLKEWTLFDHSFKRLFKNCHDERVNLMKAKFRFDRGITKDLSEFEHIIKRLSKDNDKKKVYCDAICALASRCPISPSVIPFINEVLQIQPNRVRAWKHWAYFNFGCTKITENNDNCAEYATNAIRGFSKLVQMTSPSLHYLCQLCALFFTYGPLLKLRNFKAIAENLTSLTSSSVIQIIPQLIVQFDHPNEAVRETVYTIIKNFAANHFQALTMPLCLISNTSNNSAETSQSFRDFMSQIMNDHRLVMEEAKNFADSMVSIAITDVEKVLELLDIVINFQHPNKRLRTIGELFKRIKDILSQTHHGYVADVFTKTVVQTITNRLDERYRQSRNSTSEGDHYKNNAARAKSILYSLPELYAVIDISEMEIPNFPTQPLSLVVPGFYSVHEKPVTIDRIGNILKLIPSQKRPRKLRIIGSNGKSYKYLLKGREDLRLDQRVMQLFSLTNSILHDDKFGAERKLQIHRFPIVPLATNAGLIAWAQQGETIYSLIHWHRRIIHNSLVDEKNKNTGNNNNNNNDNIISNTNNENSMNIAFQRRNSRTKLSKANIENDDKTNIEQNFLRMFFEPNGTDYALKLSSVQKLELYRTLCSLGPDTDLREALWLRSTNAELWLSQITNFARSNGLMSIIGYIIGIGDRHPSNILVMKDTGNVVHIDFSDVFEKANLRAYVHETVPFRLTRMLVKALGPSGIHGVFEMTAEYVMSLMRRSRETLLAFLDIFVQDPITDTLWYSNFNNDNHTDDSSNLNLSLSSVSESIMTYIDEEHSESLKNNRLDGKTKFSMLEKAIERISDKLNGREFEDQDQLEPHDQVTKLIQMATSEINLAQMYYGWAPYW